MAAVLSIRSGERRRREREERERVAASDESRDSRHGFGSTKDYIMGPSPRYDMNDAMPTDARTVQPRSEQAK